jgi:pimeloyl-ACP methyl ester carboxylesterase
MGRRSLHLWNICTQEVVAMPKVNVNGIEIHYEESGSGYPLVLSHELAGSWESWNDQVRYFSRRYRVIAYNDRGYPPSSVPNDPASYSEEQSVEDLRGLLDALDIPQAHIGGLSMGGAITLKFGIAHPERCRSLIIAGAGSGTTNREQFLKEQDETARVFEEQGAPAVAEFYLHGPARVQFQEKDPAGFKEFYDLFAHHSGPGSARTIRGVQMQRKSIYDVEAEVRRLNVPALVIVGDEDELCLEPALFLKRLLPNAGLAVIPKSGHTINLEEPALFNQLVLDFLTRVEQGAWHPRAELSDSMLPASLRR